MLKLEDVREMLDTRFGGALAHGKHRPGCKACAMELQAVCMRLHWTDRPSQSDVIGGALRALNDAKWFNDRERTEALLPLVCYTDADCAEGWVSRYALRTAREVLPPILRAVGLGDHADACAEAQDLAGAKHAAAAAAADVANAWRGDTQAAWHVVDAAYAAARATDAAYYTAVDAAAARAARADRAAHAATVSPALSAKILLECVSGGGDR